MGMPRGDPNGDIGIAQMADNAAAEKSNAALGLVVYERAG